MIPTYKHWLEYLLESTPPANVSRFWATPGYQIINTP